MFLTGTLLNVATVLLGTTIGLLAGSRVPPRMQGSLTTGLGFFALAISISMALPIFTSPVARPGDDLAVLAGLLLGVVVGELLRLHDGLEALGACAERRFARDESGGRLAEAFVTASLVFCIGPLTILGSLENGLSGDLRLLATKSLLDGVASIAFAAALAPASTSPPSPSSSSRVASPLSRSCSATRWTPRPSWPSRRSAASS